LFEVATYEGNLRRTFTVATDTTWKEFRERIVARLDIKEICLVYRLNVDARSWSNLSCEADMKSALTRVGEKAMVARTREVSMDIKNVVSNGPSMTDDVLTFLGCACRLRRLAVLTRVNEPALTTYLQRPQRQ
jgi:hypothetical protein